MADWSGTPTFVMAVPWEQRRVRRARELALETGARIIWDERQDPFDTYLRMMRAMGDGPAVVLEDDVILAADWRERVEAAILRHPDEVIKFWGTETEPGMTRWPGREFGQAVNVYYPPGTAADFLEWVGDRRSSFAKRYHDLYFAKYLHARRRHFFTHVPSLVQHEPWISTIMEGRRVRKSPTFGSDDGR